MALTRDQFAEQLRHHRALAGLTQTELAAQIGVNLRTYQRWEDAERTPYKRHTLALARALDVDPQVFTGTLATSDTLLRIEQAINENNRLLRQLYAHVQTDPARDGLQEAVETQAAALTRQAEILERIETLVRGLGIPDGTSLQDHLAQIARETSAQAHQAQRAAAKRS